MKKNSTCPAPANESSTACGKATAINTATEIAGNSVAQYTSATQQAYLALQQMIVTGKLAPATKLKIETLRTLLETGASPIREALSLLTSDLLVERIDQRGFRTAAISRANFEEILSLRCTLEDTALRQSIDNQSDDWEQHLLFCHRQLSCADKSDIDSFEEFHKAFHLALLANCGSPILLKYCRQLYDLNIRYRYMAGNSLDYNMRNVADEHTGIMEAALARNRDLAAERLLTHYRQTGAFLTGLLSSDML